tara:strand:+ start:7595 stop:9565 length:1971 start_codon:yes stop_codon:yes gene_type:complete
MIGQKFLDLIFRVKAEKAKKDIDEVGTGLKKVGIGGKVAAGGLKMVGRGFQFVGRSIKAAGIGLIVALMASLTQVFTQNQQVMDKFSKMMIKLQPIFKGLGEVISGLLSYFQTLIDYAIQAINFFGDLLGLGTINIKQNNEFADTLVRLRNEVKLMNAELALTQLEYQKEAEIQRQLRDDTSLTIDERIKANERLGEVLKEQMEVETEAAKQALELAEKELWLDSDNIDKQVALIDAKVKLAEIDERITSQRSEQLTNLNSLEQERIDLQKTADEERVSQLEKLLKLQNKDLDIKEEIKGSINEQLDAAKDAHLEIMSMLKKELSAKLLIIEQEQKARQESLTDRIWNLHNELDELFKKGRQEMYPDYIQEQINVTIAEIERLESESDEIRSDYKKHRADTMNEFNRLMNDQTKGFNQTQEDLVLQAEKKLNEHFETAKQKEIRETKEKYDELYGLAENSFFDTMRLRIEEAVTLKAIDEKYENERLAGVRKFYALMEKFGKEQAKKEIKIEKNKQKLIAQGASDSMQKAVALTEQGTASYKALASAETIMSTYSAATAALNTYKGTPFGWIQAGLIIATGAKNLAEIAKTKVPGSTETISDTGGSLGGDMSGDVPGGIVGQLGDIDSPPIQAYVVESDISTAQTLQGEINTQATL